MSDGPRPLAVVTLLTVDGTGPDAGTYSRAWMVSGREDPAALAERMNEKFGPPFAEECSTLENVEEAGRQTAGLRNWIPQLP